MLASLLLIGALYSSSPTCSLSPLVISFPGFDPAWIVVTLTGLDPSDQYTFTLTEPNSKQLSDTVGQVTFYTEAFDVGIFQSGLYSTALVEVGKHKILASCSLRE